MSKPKADALAALEAAVGKLADAARSLHSSEGQVKAAKLLAEEVGDVLSRVKVECDALALDPESGS